MLEGGFGALFPPTVFVAAGAGSADFSRFFLGVCLTAAPLGSFSFFLRGFRGSALSAPSSSLLAMITGSLSVKDTLRFSFDFGGGQNR